MRGADGQLCFKQNQRIPGKADTSGIERQLWRKVHDRQMSLGLSRGMVITVEEPATP